MLFVKCNSGPPPNSRRIPNVQPPPPPADSQCTFWQVPEYVWPPCTLLLPRSSLPLGSPPNACAVVPGYLWNKGVLLPKLLPSLCHLSHASPVSVPAVPQSCHGSGLCRVGDVQGG